MSHTISMDMKKIGNFDATLGIPSTPARTNIPSSGPSFKDALNSIGTVDIKKTVGDQALTEKGLKFSNHAIERMQSRGIMFKAEDMSRLNEAVDRAANKGSRDSLILMNDSALIVSVKNRTVVTVMDKSALKENVFTNIDSTIVM